MAGQKSDLNGRREVSTEEAEKWANENGLPFLETSAKNDYNVERIFSRLAVDIYNRIHDGRLLKGFRYFDGVKFFKGYFHYCDVRL